MTQDAPLDQKLEADAWLSAANAATDRGVPHLDAKAIVRAYLSALSRRVPASGGEAEPPAVALLRGPLSKRATSAEFNEWQAREVVAYIDRLLAASPIVAAPEELSYTRIIEIVNDCTERMKRGGESHRMLARWISEDIHAALAAAPSTPEGKAEPGEAAVIERCAKVVDAMDASHMPGVNDITMGYEMGLSDAAAAIRALSTRAQP